MPITADEYGLRESAGCAPSARCCWFRATPASISNPPPPPRELDGTVELLPLLLLLLLLRLVSASFGRSELIPFAGPNTSYLQINLHDCSIPGSCRLPPPRLINARISLADTRRIIAVRPNCSSLLFSGRCVLLNHRLVHGPQRSVDSRVRVFLSRRLLKSPGTGSWERSVFSLRSNRKRNQSRFESNSIPVWKTFRHLL